MKLLDIQEEKINDVVKLLSEDKFNNQKPLYFQAPTGSGKTKMLARIIEEYKKINPSEKIIFLVASISTGGIEKQNYYSLLESQKNGCDFKVEHISSGLTSPIKPSIFTDVLTIGEASFKNKSLLFENKLLETYLWQQTSNNKKIVFIRDEAHIGTKQNEDSQNISKLNKYFSKILYLSATFECIDDKIKNNEAIIMSLEEAQENKLIKNWIILNNDGDIHKNINEKILFEHACDKLIDLKSKYSSFSKILNENINPALLVQISNVEKGDDQIKEITDVCNQKKLTYAFALDKTGECFDTFGSLSRNKKIKRTDLQKNGSDIDVIIFKYSVATGWNIPRAAILCQYRNVQKETLHLQTLGRVMRNIFVGKDDLFSQLTEEKQKIVLTCWLYSFHDSAKIYQSFTLQLKDKFKNENILITKARVGHNTNEKGKGYVSIYKQQMVEEILKYFNDNYKNTEFESILNGKGELVIEYEKLIKIGVASNDIDIQNSDSKKINFINKIISNQIQLVKEFFGLIEKDSPALKNVLLDVLEKLGTFPRKKLFMIATIKNTDFWKKIISIKRSYQTKWESKEEHWKDVIDKVLVPLQNDVLRGSEILNNSEEFTCDDIRHIVNIFTNFDIDNDSDLSKIFTGPEKHFLKKLDKFVENKPNFIGYVHRNLPSIAGISYTYFDADKGYRKSYPDFILKTLNGTIIICEIKAEYDIDPNKSESIIGGYHENSKEIRNYFFGLIKNKNNKFRMYYSIDGKKLGQSVNFLSEYEKALNDFTDLDVLFNIVELWEKENIKN